MMISARVVAAPAVCRTRPPMPTPITATRLTATAPKNMARSTPGWTMATATCWPANIRWPSSKPATLPSSVTGNANAAVVAALAASTSGLAGMALKVDRIMPVEYSAVTVRTASAPRTTAAIMTPLSEALLGRHGVPLADLGEGHGDAEADAHDQGQGGGSPGGGQGAKLRPLRLEGPADRGGSHRPGRGADVGRGAHVRLLGWCRPAGRRGSRFRLGSARRTPPRATRRAPLARGG